MMELETLFDDICDVLNHENISEYTFLAPDSKTKAVKHYTIINNKLYLSYLILNPLYQYCSERLFSNKNDNISKVMLLINTGNYCCYNYRKRFIIEDFKNFLNTSTIILKLESELSFINLLASNHCKEYELFAYRAFIIYILFNYYSTNKLTIPPLGFLHNNVQFNNYKFIKFNFYELKELIIKEYKFCRTITTIKYKRNYYCHTYMLFLLKYVIAFMCADIIRSELINSALGLHNNINFLDYSIFHYRFRFLDSIIKSNCGAIISNTINNDNCIDLKDLNINMDLTIDNNIKLIEQIIVSNISNLPYLYDIDFSFTNRDYNIANLLYSIEIFLNKNTEIHNTTKCITCKLLLYELRAYFLIVSNNKDFLLHQSIYNYIYYLFTHLFNHFIYINSSIKFNVSVFRYFLLLFNELLYNREDFGYHYHYFMFIFLLLEFLLGVLSINNTKIYSTLIVLIDKLVSRFNNTDLKNENNNLKHYVMNRFFRLRSMNPII